MSNNIKRIFALSISVITTLFYSVISFGAPPTTDISVGYLSKIFGSVGDVLNGASSGVMGVLFNDLNCGVLGIATTIISYTTIRVIVDTAHDGEPMGKKISQWIVARTAAGIGLLIPKASGYTLLQSLLMSAVLAGVTTADTIWTHVIERIEGGGVLFETSTSQGTGSKTKVDLELITGGDPQSAEGTPDAPQFDTYAGSMSLLRSQVCMKLLEQSIKKEQAAVSDAIKEGRLQPGTKSYQQAKQFVDNVISLSAGVDEKTHMATFPGKSSFTNFDSLQANLTGACGTYRMEWSAGYKSDQAPGATGDDKTYADVKTAAVQSMLDDVKKLGDEVLSRDVTKDKDEASLKEFNQRAVEMLVSIGSKYQSTIADYRLKKAMNYKTRQEAASKEEQEKLNFLKKAKERGWATAGEYVYELIKVADKNVSDSKGYYRIWSGTDELQGQKNLVPSPRVISKPIPNSSDSANPYMPTTALSKLYEIYNKQNIGDVQWKSKEFADSLEKVLIWTRDIQNSAYSSNVVSYVRGLNKMLTETNAGLAVDDDARFKQFLDTYATSSGADMVQGMPNEVTQKLNVAIRNVMTEWQDKMVKSTSVMSPMQSLYGVGNSMIVNAVSFWDSIITSFTTWYYIINSVSLAANSVAAVATGVTSVAISSAAWGTDVGSSVASIGTTIAKITGMIGDFVWKCVEYSYMLSMPMAMGITSMMFTMGFALCYYVPFIPYMLFTFGVISWLIFVIEAMTASAIVALALMDPRAGGDEIFGRAEPTLGFAMAVFLRPSTMLIGLLAGTMLSYVGVNVVNSTFVGFIHSFLETSGGMTGVDRIKFVAMIFIYNTIMMSLVVKCYECIYLIPDQIMSWIGVHSRPSTDAQLVHDMKHGVSQAAGEGAGAATRSADRGGELSARSGAGFAQLGQHAISSGGGKKSDKQIKAEQKAKLEAKQDFDTRGGQDE